MYIYIYIYGDPANVRPAEVRISHFCRSHFCMWKIVYIYIYNIRKFVRAETGKNATLQLIIYIHRLKFAGDEIGRTATIVDNIYIYILTVNNKHMCRYI